MVIFVHAEAQAFINTLREYKYAKGGQATGKTYSMQGHNAKDITGDVTVSFAKPERKFRLGRDPEDTKALTHTYEQFLDGTMMPMCNWGYNRDQGRSFKVQVDEVGTEGLCIKCHRNKRAGKPAVLPLNGHPTKR